MRCIKCSKKLRALDKNYIPLPDETTICLSCYSIDITEHSESHTVNSICIDFQVTAKTLDDEGYVTATIKMTADQYNLLLMYKKP